MRNILSTGTSARSLATNKMLEDPCEMLRNVIVGYETGVDAHARLKEPTALHFVGLHLSRGLLIAYHVIIVCAVFTLICSARTFKPGFL